jgi:hypothetical protein
VASFACEKTMLDALRAEDFEALSGQPLTLAAGQIQLPVEIGAVRRLQSPSPRQTPPFSVTFRHRDAKGAAPQGMYRMQLPDGQSVDLFVVPLGPDGKGMCYEAVFN